MIRTVEAQRNPYKYSHLFQCQETLSAVKARTFIPFLITLQLAVPYLPLLTMYLLTALALMLGSTVLAHPADNIPSEGNLHKRDVETIHFARCETYNDIFYYADDAKSHEFPGKDNECVPGRLILGSESSCRFPTGVVLRYFLGANAYNAAFNSVVGWADNGFHSYTCRRANDRLLFVDGNGHSCTDAFYCRVSNHTSEGQRSTC